MKSKDDSYYIKKVLRGDTSAYSFLVGKYQDMVFTICVQMLKNDDDANDMAQEVFIKAYQKLKDFKGNAKFSTWLYRIAHNMVISKLRKKTIVDATNDEGALERSGGYEVPLSEMEDDQREVRLLQNAIKQLNSEEQVIITLHYYEGKSIDEISKIVLLSTANVKVKLFRIRKKLKEVIDAENTVYYNSLN